MAENHYIPTLKGYKYKQELGRGGFGTVWHFYDPNSGRDVAVKRVMILSESETDTVSQTLIHIYCIIILYLLHSVLL